RVIENRSTAKGYTKLKLMKSLARMKMEALVRSRPNQSITATSFQGYDELHKICNIDGLSDPRVFFEALYKFSVNPATRLSNGPRHYLHLVFRHYADGFHALAVRKGLVCSSPSLIRYMDTANHNIYLTGTAPLEFRSFVTDIGDRICKVECMPMPRIGTSVTSGTSAQRISYSENHESIPCVSLTRSVIARTFSRWQSDVNHYAGVVYPEILCVQSSSPISVIYNIIDQIVCLCEARKHLKESGCDIDWLTSCINPALGSLFMKYETHQFVTDGEQLMERYSWFLRPSIRSLFQAIAGENFHELLFFHLKLDICALDPFMTYCSRRPFTRKAHDDQRIFVKTMRQILHAFHVVS
ncbi:unnamed protein product, partial [Phaeothamnion confervicola]